MELDINKAAQPFHYYMKFLKEDCRPDARKLSDIRHMKIDTGALTNTNGSALVRFGSTVVLCGIKARLCRPRDDRPDRGFIVPNVDLPPLCSSIFKPGSPSEQAHAMTQLMFDVLNESQCIRESDLCIQPGKLVWSLNIDLVCLNYDGNVQDVCCAAMISALKNTSLYECSWDEETERPVVSYPVKTSPLKLYNEPVCTTMFVIDDSVLICDPNREEEEFAKAFITICTVDENRMCLMRKFGGEKMRKDKLDLAMDRALQNGTFIRKKLNEINGKKLIKSELN